MSSLPQPRWTTSRHTCHPTPNTLEGTWQGPVAAGSGQREVCSGRGGAAPWSPASQHSGLPASSGGWAGWPGAWPSWSACAATFCPRGPTGGQRTSALGLLRAVPGPDGVHLLGLSRLRLTGGLRELRGLSEPRRRRPGRPRPRVYGESGPRGLSVTACWGRTPTGLFLSGLCSEVTSKVFFFSYF